MLKVFKYLFIASLYNKAKKNFLLLFGSIISLILISLIINDAISVASGISVYVLLIVKWISILSLLLLIGYSVLKIINIATSPFSNGNKEANPLEEEVIDTKKDRILNKEKLFTRSDLILQKYMKDK